MAYSYSSVDVMTVRDMIDNSIVFADCNPTVDFKMIESVLYILGRHLNLLERHIQIEWAQRKARIKKSIKVTEMKVHTRKKSKTKSSTEKSSTEKSGAEYTTTEKSTTERSATRKSTAGKTRGPKSSRKQRSSVDSYTDEKKTRRTSKSRSRERDSSPTRTRDPKSSRRQRSSVDSYTDEKKTRRRSKSRSGDRDSSPTRTSGPKSSHRQRSSVDSYTDEKKTRRRSMSRSGDRDSSPTGTSGPKSSRRQRSSVDSYTDEKKTRRTSLSRSRERESSLTRTPGAKSSRRQRSSVDSYTDEKKTRRRSGERESFSKQGGPSYTAYTIEEKTGKQGRKFKTRATDDEEKAEVKREKLLIVSRTSLDVDGDRYNRGSVVTEEQFDKLVAEVRRLQAKYGIKDMFAESGTPWLNLHKPTSLTDPKAALNMSARLDSVETKLSEMLELLTKFARKVPGIDIDKAFAEAGQFSGDTSKRGDASTTGAIQDDADEMFMAEDLLAPDTDVEVDSDGYKPWVTWKQLKDGLDCIRADVTSQIGKTATGTTDIANNAAKLFRQAEPKLCNVQHLELKFVKLKFLAERFGNNVTLLDNELTTQMCECQDGLSQMQFDLELTLEHIDDIVAHPKTDPTAVNALKEEFTGFQYLIFNSKQRQLELQNLHTHNSAGLDVLRKKIEAVRMEKITRDDVDDALKEKMSILDLNGLLSREQYHAVVGFIQQMIRATNDRIRTGEFGWQKYIDDFVSELYESANREQVETLNHSLNTYTTMYNIAVDKMLDIVGPYPFTGFKKKLDRSSNCLSCGAPADVTVSDAHMKIALELMAKQVPELQKAENIEIQKPCIPGSPITHPLDPRGLICERFCGASVCKSEETLPSSFGIDIIDINPVKTTDMQSQVYLNLNIPCTPCNHSEDKYTLFK